jgi:hypothetical protein
MTYFSGKPKMREASLFARSAVTRSSCIKSRLGQSIEAKNVVNATSGMQPSELNGRMYKLSAIV